MQAFSTVIDDLAISWHADHDDRIIQVLERLYLTGPSSCPVVFAGERRDAALAPGL